MSQLQAENINLLTDSQRQLITSLGYEIGENYKTHSSVFYKLTKDSKQYLLKIDRTNSGSLLHQQLYSTVQVDLGLPHLKCEYLAEDNSFLIMEKLENAVMLKEVISTELLKERGRQMRKIHDNGPISEYCKMWDTKFNEFETLSKQEIIEDYLYETEFKLNKLSLEDEMVIRSIVEFIENNMEKFDDSISFIHGDSHWNNVIVDENKPIIIDPNGTVLYGSRYLDLTIVAIDFPGYFDKTLEKTSNDFDYFSAFLEGYGDIDFQQLYYFICLRGAERFSLSKTILNVDLLTKCIFSKLTS